MGLFRFLSFRYAPHRSWKALAVLPFIGVLLALAGPFGSYVSMTFWARCAHFALCFTAIGFAILEGAYRLARRYFMGNWPLGVALGFDLALTLPATTIVWGSLHVFSPTAIGHVRFVDLVWQNLLIILTVQAIVVVVAIVRQPHMPPPVPAALVEDRFPLADRLPFALKRAQVMAVTSEDHYLRVYTAGGEALIHMTMNEAAAILGAGFQIHRSHWVAAGAIKGHTTDRVDQTTGLSLPISRHRRREFEAWLDTL